MMHASGVELDECVYAANMAEIVRATARIGPIMVINFDLIKACERCTFNLSRRTMPPSML